MLISITTFIKQLTDSLKKQNPDLSAKPGSVIHDSFIIPTASAMAWMNATTTLATTLTSLTSILAAQKDTTFKADLAESLAMSLNDIDNLLTSSIDKIGSNYGLIRKTSQKAYGLASFYITTIPTADIRVPANTLIESSQKIQFETTSEIVFETNKISTLYDSTLNAYAIDVPIQAIEAGAAGNVAANTLVYTTSPLADFDGVTNKFAISTGYEEETDSEFIDRILTTLRGTNLETKDGMKALILNNLPIRSIFIADAQSKYQIRNNGKGGVVDIYTADSIPTVVTDTVTHTSTEHILQHQPSSDILSVKSIDGTVTYNDGTDYTYIPDTNSLVLNSTAANNKLVWLSGGNAPAVETDYIVEYVYNQHIENINNLVNNDEHRPLMGNITSAVLVREGIRILVDIGYKLTIYAEYNRATVLTNCAVAIQAYINSLPFGASIAQSDIVSILENVSGVNYVNTTPLKFQRQDQSEIQDVIYSLAYEYLRTGDIILQ